MDQLTILMRAFFIGVTSACGIGPVFVLLCNTAVRKGFLAAFSIAIGAAMADSIYFYGALSGLLSWWHEIDWLMRFFDMGMFIFFAFLGLNILYSKKEKVSIETVEPQRYYEGFLQGLFLTLLNPFVAVYFLGVSAKLLPISATKELTFLGFDAVIAATAGSCSMLTLIAALVSFIGINLNDSRLDMLNKVTAYVFLLLAAYFAYSFSSGFLY